MLPLTPPNSGTCPLKEFTMPTIRFFTLWFLLPLLFVACTGSSNHTWQLETLTPEDQSISDRIKVHFKADRVVLTTWRPQASEITWNKNMEGRSREGVFIKYLVGKANEAVGRIGMVADYEGQFYPLDPEARNDFRPDPLDDPVVINYLDLRKYLDDRSNPTPSVGMIDRRAQREALRK